MNAVDEKIALEFKGELLKKIPIKDFKIFGSRAFGNNYEDSDMDIYIKVQTLTRDIKRLIFDIAWRVGYDNNIVISPLIYSTDEIENSPLRSSQIIKNINQNGITL